MTRYPPAIFVGDAPALDFLNSIATPADAPVDWIGDGEGLLRWLAQARLAPDATLETIRAQAPPGELDRVADQARALREWFRGFVRARMGAPLTEQALPDLEPLNLLLSREEYYRRIASSPDGPPLRLETIRRWRRPEALLSPIAEALAQFVCIEDFSNVKACEGPVCTLLFADHTRGHRRRWCSMALCGNRAKQAAHRQRLREPG